LGNQSEKNNIFHFAVSVLSAGCGLWRNPGGKPMRFAQSGGASRPFAVQNETGLGDFTPERECDTLEEPR